MTMPVPPFLYGTAWKEDRTAALVKEALGGGFRGIDTANQRRHYFEAAVGEGIRASGVPREELFIQTKFTYAESQDHRLPYDPRADFPTQVRQSFASSLEHLGVDTIDSYILHGPRAHRGLSDADWEVWRTMEALHREGRTRAIGVSNVSAEQLELLCAQAEVRPAFVQNRCFARFGWDREVREVCRREGVTYQGFSLLTANARELQSPAVREIAARHGRTIAQVAFRFALQVGMVCLTGTTDPRHMREDLAVLEFELTDEEVRTMER
ncbi:MAG: aldo/keto reductase family protein [Thermoanaerobaculia bacterium]